MEKKTTNHPKGFFWKNDVTTLILRLLFAYLCLVILQTAFYMIDKPYLGHINGFAEAWNITKGSFVYNIMSLLWTNCLFILLSILPFRIREKRWYQGILYAIFLVTNTAMIVLNGSDVVYFSHTMKRFTLEETHFTSNSNNIPILIDFLQHNLPISIICVALIALLIYGWHYIKYQPTKIENKKRYYLVNSITAVIVIFLCFCGMRGTFNPTKPWVKMSEAASYSPEKSWLMISNPYCLLRSLDKDLEYDKVTYFDADELDQTYTPEHCIDSSRYDLGHRNVVVFILESFSKEHSKFLNPDLYKYESGCTPFLDSLMQKGYTFTNAYANGQKSIEAVPAILASIPSFKTSFATMPELFGDFEAMPEILAKQGYQTAFFSGGEHNSMGFEDITHQFGVQQCYCRNDFEAAYPVNDSTIEPFWGVFDMPFFQFMADEIDKMKEPFFTSVFSLTSHHPYRVPPDYYDVIPRGHTIEQRVVAYTDLSIRIFFDRIKHEPWFNNTLFVFAADHVSPICYDPQSYTMQGHTSIIEFLYTPDGALRGLDNTIVQQLDIMPTVLGLIGNKEPYFAFGRDVFNEPERQPVAFNFINQVYQYITDSTVFYHDSEKVLKTVKGEVQQKDEDFLKAMLQRYSESLSQQNYKVKE
jgi:arylsulfatase A-like enzyme